MGVPAYNDLLKQSFSSQTGVSSYQKDFNKYLNSQKPSYQPFKNSSLNTANTFKSSLTSGVTKGLSRAFFPAYLGFEGVDYMSNVALEMYDKKFKELGLGKYSKDNEMPQTFDSVPLPTPSPAPTPMTTTPSPLYEGDTLLSVLKDSTLVNTAIARQLEASNAIALHSNNELNNSIKALTSLMSLQSEIDISYREVELESSININNSLYQISSSINDMKMTMSENKEIDVAYNEQNLSNFDTSMNHLDNIASKVATVSMILSNGIEVQKSQDEVNLTAKQLEHITYETTEIQLDNLGDNIPSATPQTMRAIKDAVVAKKNSDENTFDVDDEDLTDWFTMPDLTTLFNYNYKSTRTIEGVNS